MIATVFSSAIVGIEGNLVRVEVDISRGNHKIFLVGLPDKAVSEAKERIYSSIKNSGFQFPKGKITINLAPANLPKTGSVYDLSVAAAILKASGQIKLDENTLLIGELSLDGKVRPVNGILPVLLSNQSQSISKIIIPENNKNEASYVNTGNVYYISKLSDLAEGNINKIIAKSIKNTQILKSEYQFENIIGQRFAKKALEIAAAGGHNCLLTGVPGSGKTYLSRAIVNILPPLSQNEIIEVTKIYSVSGLLDLKNPIIVNRPFRSPHHTASTVSLTGGGSVPKPGEITLAHKGVLFLDELPEFNRQSLEALRQPLEDKIVNISRASANMTFPADFILISAMNPCKCGFRGDPEKECICTNNEVIKYQKKISGPILDRFDLKVTMPKLNTSKLINLKKEESSYEVQKRVMSAREIQLSRFKSDKLNSQMNSDDIKKYVNLDNESINLLQAASDNLKITARAYFKILKVSRTIADLALEDKINSNHILEALSYRRE